MSELESILITPLKIIPVAGGDVMHAMKDTDTGFNGYGEVYFSSVDFRAIKAWKMHLKMTMNIVVPTGLVNFVFFSEDLQSLRLERIGKGRYQRITIPPRVWFGFQGASQDQNLILNIANIQHDPLEVLRKDVGDIKFNWKDLL